MRSSTVSTFLTTLSSLSTFISAAPLFPLPNGFPLVANPSQELTSIQIQAHGSLPNGSPPPKISADSLTSLQLIAFNELSEVAFFSELITNITNNVEGFQFSNSSTRDTILRSLTAIVAQEELHELNANGAVTAFGGQGPIQACEYDFPVSTFIEAVALASTFTDVVLGTLQDVQTLLGTDGDNDLIRGIGSVQGQEGQQSGYYRTLIGKIPSALPFLTTSTREFAFSALNQLFIVPGSCPNIGNIQLPIFQPLNVDTSNIEPLSQNLQFSISIDPTNWNSDNPGLSMVYINQLNLPVTEKLQNIVVQGNRVTFEALFPYDPANFGNGLTIAALTSCSGPFTSVDQVAKATVYGPGLIEIN
ncbi:hypothetical protein B7494_g1499 [Chlorociboria aeruginascens]|nr:hypothetical protein B7494_g1499 [Chlorociboria aeruginascens]